MKTPMPPAIHWCPFCHVAPYKSKGNLNNHIEEKHEPQRHHRCLECQKSWNTKLGRSRHIRRTKCSSQRFVTTHHSHKKRFYSCGICASVFDDFELRQEHLLIHQQSGAPRSAWTEDTMMHGLLAHTSIAVTWDLLVFQRIPYLDSQTLSWNWSDPRVVNALNKLECNRFGNDQELQDILNDVLATLTNVDEMANAADNVVAIMQQQTFDLDDIDWTMI